MSRRSLVTGVLLFLAGLAGYAVGMAQEAAAPPAAAPAPPELKTLEDKAAYAIGQNIGQSILQDKLTLNPDLIARGLTDALKKARPALPPEDVEAVMIAFTKQ